MNNEEPIKENYIIMPNPDIDYSNTIIYKITCKDPEIKDVYVGHTTNFVQRKSSHKQGCINPKSSNYDCKLYNTIREKGGWTNWKMEIVNFFNCVNQYEARQKEQEYFISLNANLNSIEPIPTPKEKTLCNNKNKQITLQEIATSDNVLSIKNANKYSCILCGYYTSRKSEFDRHLSRQKHKNNDYAMKISENNKNSYYICKCKREYMSFSGLWKHKKKCQYENLSPKKPEPDNSNVLYLTNIVLEVIKGNNELQKQNKDFQLQIMEYYKNNSNKIMISDSVPHEVDGCK